MAGKVGEVEEAGDISTNNFPRNHVTLRLSISSACRAAVRPPVEGHRSITLRNHMKIAQTQEHKKRIERGITSGRKKSEEKTKLAPQK